MRKLLIAVFFLGIISCVESETPTPVKESPYAEITGKENSSARTKSCLCNGCARFLWDMTGTVTVETQDVKYWVALHTFPTGGYQGNYFDALPPPVVTYRIWNTGSATWKFRIGGTGGPGTTVYPGTYETITRQAIGSCSINDSVADFSIVFWRLNCGTIGGNNMNFVVQIYSITENHTVTFAVAGSNIGITSCP